MAGYQGTSTRRIGHESQAGMIEAERRDIRSVIRGRVISYNFNGGSPTVKVKPLLKQKFGDKELEMPDLEDVPVRQFRGGGVTINSKLKPGDEGELVFNDRAMDAYQNDGELIDGAPSRMNDLSDAVFYPTGQSEKRKMSGVPDDGTWMGTDDGKRGVHLKDDGSVVMKKEEATITIDSSKNVTIVPGPGAKVFMG